MISAMTTLANLHRHNEIIALLAAGIPTRRELLPILFGTLIVITLGIVNRETILPAYSEMLQRYHEDIEGERVLLPTMNIDKDQVLFRADRAFREDNRLENVNITFPVEITGVLQEVHCMKAYYKVSPDAEDAGWVLDDVDTAVDVTNTKGKLRRSPDGKLFVRTNVSFNDMIRQSNWKSFAGTFELVNLLQREEIKDPQNVRILIHNRIMDPALHFVLVLLGLPFVLQWERKNVFAGIAIAMGLCGAFFVTNSMAGYMASYGYMDAVLAAWIPLFIFGPIAMYLFPRIGT